jgi:hypothetical protein
MLCFQPELVLPDCSAGLLGQEDEVLADSDSGTDLLTDCTNGSDTVAEDTALELLMLLRWTLVLPELLRLVA